MTTYHIFTSKGYVCIVVVKGTLLVPVHIHKPDQGVQTAVNEDTVIQVAHTRKYVEIVNYMVIFKKIVLNLSKLGDPLVPSNQYPRRSGSSNRQ